MAVLTLAAMLALAGCSGGGEEAGAPAADVEAGRDGALDHDGAAPNPEPDPGRQADPGEQGGAAPPAGGTAAARRAIVFTGSIVVRVEDVDEAAAQVAAIVAGAGGFVGGDQRYSADSRSEAKLTLRVPAREFYPVVERIADLGEQERRDIRTQDVTEEVLDLDARIATQRARVESGRRLLARAKTLQELIQLEGELARREADLASLEAKKRRLDDLTALSTVTVTLLGPKPEVPTAGPKAPQTGFLIGLRAGWKAFVASVQVLLTVLGALLPWVVTLALILVPLWLVGRTRRARRPVAPPVGGPTGPGPLPTPPPARVAGQVGASATGPVPGARAPQDTLEDSGEAGDPKPRNG
ncbi:MAG TPA: DUF4349 domain-containing protein [Micromonosporaceae bacterium]